MENTKELFRIEDEGLVVEYEVLPLIDDSNTTDPRLKKIYQGLSKVEERLNVAQEKLDKLNSDIDRLTNHADGFDYMIAVASGTLTGLIDVFFIGEMDFKTAKGNTHQRVNHFIQWYAKSNGFSGDRLKDAIIFLEDKFPVDQDSAYQGMGIGIGSRNHHLDDLAHHPTVVGMIAAIIVQLFRCGIFVNKNGEWHFTKIETTKEDLLKIWSPILISGILLWLTNLAKNKYKANYGKELPQPVIKLVKLLAAAPAVLELLSVVNNWVGHLVSDMGGSRNTPGGGMGLAGIFISLLKEISSIPPLNYTKLPQIVNDLYSKQKIDLRTELAFVSELGRQSVPVILNELIVRGFYFVRRLLLEVGNKKFTEVNWNKINWQNVIPFRNRTITRMITIASGTFTAIDLADAGIRAAVKSGGNMAAFLGSFILRINFVGIGRFAVACYTDIKMGIERSKLIDERMKVNSEMIFLNNAKVFYKQADMWVAAENASIAIEEIKSLIPKMTVFFNSQFNEMESDLEESIRCLRNCDSETRRRVGQILRY